MLRALKQRTQTVCFMTGHGEPFEERPPHVHYSHVEALGGENNPGSEDVVVGPDEGLDRLRLALEAFGYAARAVVPATVEAIPEDCAVVADVGRAAVMLRWSRRSSRPISRAAGGCC